MNEDKLFKFILKCQKNHYKPDLHSFRIAIDNGTAYIDCRQHEVFIEYYVDDCKKQWCGLAIAAANLLELLKADINTIDV